MFLISGGDGRAEEESGRPGVSAAEERGGQKGFRDVNGKTAELRGGKTFQLSDITIQQHFQK